MAAPTNLRRTFSGKRVLITGGLGFIGSNLARALLALGARVSVVDSLMPEYGGNRRNLAGVSARIKVHVADVRDWPRLPSLVRGQDYLFNLAGQTSHMDSMTDPADGSGHQLPGPTGDSRSLSTAQSGDPNRVRQHASDLRPARLPAWMRAIRFAQST